MHKHEAIAIRDAVLEFCKKENWSNPQAVTLTLKQARMDGTVWVPLTQLEAQQNLRHVLNVLHKKLAAYGFRKQDRLRCAAMHEGGNAVRHHYHLMLDRPDCIEAAEYEGLIKYEWARSHWGYKQVTIVPCYDENGWLDYISKLHTKDDYAASIDWTNFR
jgi:hypothetical protein